MEKNKKYITRVVESVLDQIAELYLYFLVIYFVCFIFSLFFERWKLFFDWELFHFSIVLFGVLSLLSNKGRRWISAQRKLVKFKKLLVKREKVPIVPIVPIVRSATVFIRGIVKGLVRFGKWQIIRISQRLTKKDYIKLGLMIAILTYALYKEIDPINFLVLAYALASILFVMEGRIAAFIALIFLTSCPILLIFKKESFAEVIAIYAFYFLVICVVTQMREYLREERVHPVKYPVK